MCIRDRSMPAFIASLICLSAALFLIKAFSYIGFFVIIAKPPCIAVPWALREVGLRTASAVSYTHLSTPKNTQFSVTV